MRTALEECISFHTVSLSTCRGRRAGFSVPPAGGGQEWGWTLGQPAAMLGRKGGAKIGRTIHQPPLAGALLTPIPPQGSMAYIFWLMGPAGKRNRATLEVASTAKAVGWGVQRAVSSVIEKDPSPGQASAAHTSWEMSVPCSGGTSCLWGRQQGKRGRIIWKKSKTHPHHQAGPLTFHSAMHSHQHALIMSYSTGTESLGGMQYGTVPPLPWG